MRLYRKEDGDRAFLTGKRIAVIGFGNQGRAQALNLRDSGCDVVIGNRDDDYAELAKNEGFTVRSISDACREAEIVMLLLPDEVLPEVFSRQVAGVLRANCALCYASGHAVAFGEIRPPEQCDVLLLAPRMIGLGVRQLYQDGRGFFSFFAVEKDVTGFAKQTVLALADAIGSLSKGALEVTFRMEAELDLFNEQAFGPAFGKAMLSAIYTLTRAGYPPEAVLLELYMSGELGYIFQTVGEKGFFENLRDHSETAQFGAMTRSTRFLRINFMKPMAKILASIRSGNFARDWKWEKRLGKPRLKLFRWFAFRQPLARWEKRIRQLLHEDSKV